jgi:hypothetical protein
VPTLGSAVAKRAAGRLSRSDWTTAMSVIVSAASTRPLARVPSAKAMSTRLAVPTT